MLRIEVARKSSAGTPSDELVVIESACLVCSASADLALADIRDVQPSVAGFWRKATGAFA